MKKQTLTMPVLSVLVASMALVACNRRDETPTSATRDDTAVSRTEQKAAEVKSDVAKGAQDVKDAAKGAADTMGDKVNDAVITTSVNAELAKDPGLSALRINVDTSNGAVALRGTAPDAAARDRATQLASSVKGVTRVDNQLTVGEKK
jgi:hyperosmotically inducible protein